MNFLRIARGAGNIIKGFAEDDGERIFKGIVQTATGALEILIGIPAPDTPDYNTD